MRINFFSAAALLCLLTAGCSSRGVSVEDLLTQLSHETTASITPSVASAAPIPSGVVGSASSEAAASQIALSMLPEQAMTVPSPMVQTAAMVPVPSPKSFPSNRNNGRQTIYKRQFGDAKPINFGTTSPHKLPVHGIDVSRWQADIDWQNVRRQGANFVYIKATDGGDHLDPLFRKNWQAASNAGLKHGAYHFFYWCRTGSEQADWFIRNVPREPNALPPVLDVEWNAFSQCKKRPSKADVIAKMRAFIDKVEKHYGQKPIIYTAPDFYKDNLQGEFLDYPFWLRSVAAHPSKVYPGRNWVLWQYSGTGLSSAVKGKLDLNVFNGSESQWHRWVQNNTRS